MKRTRGSIDSRELVTASDRGKRKKARYLRGEEKGWTKERRDEKDNGWKKEVLCG